MTPKSISLAGLLTLALALLGGCASRPEVDASAGPAPCRPPLEHVRQRIQTNTLLYTVSEDFPGMHQPMTPTGNFQTVAEYDRSTGAGCR